jgi:D-alanyl-D-alanine carboxypeptidase
MKNSIVKIILALLLYSHSSKLSAQSKAFLTGRYNYAKDTSFVRVPNQFARNNVFLKREAYHAFLKMRQAALQSGIVLTIISGTRSFNDQKWKWESKWNAAQFRSIKDDRKKAIELLRWWSMPGTSRHHWGTDIDLNNMKVVYYRTAAGKKLYEWLVNNAPKFGFQQPFNANRKSGYQEEKWHWSYVPLSINYLKVYVQQINYLDINGYQGFHTAKDINVIKNWVLAVNPRCK